MTVPYCVRLIYKIVMTSASPTILTIRQNRSKSSNPELNKNIAELSIGDFNVFLVQKGSVAQM